MIEHSVYSGQLSKELRAMAREISFPIDPELLARIGDRSSLMGLYDWLTVPDNRPGSRDKRKAGRPHRSLNTLLYPMYAADWILLRAQGVPREKAYEKVAQNTYFGRPSVTTKTLRKIIKMAGWEGAFSGK